MVAGRTHSISIRLMWMNILVSGVALLLACAGFFVYDQITFRQEMVRILSAQAQIIGSNSVSAILFNDPESASETLSALRSSQNIASAGIFTSNRQAFAKFSRDSVDEILTVPTLPPDEIEAHWFRSRHLVMVRQIFSEGKPIGFVYLRADLRGIEERLKRYALIALSVLLMSLVVAVFISSAFRKAVAQPIIHLAEIARDVSRDKDYSIRVTQMSNRDELAILIDSFNEMLREIQQRDIALQRARDGLEQRVSDRTRELVSANRELEAFSYSVSHDLRGPLDSLNGFSYVLLKQYGSRLDEQGRDLIEHIRSSGRRMTELIDTLLNLSRVTTSVMHTEKVDLSELARSTMEELCRSEPGRKVEFVAPAREEAFGDVRLLRIVMENLLRNAWKYTSQHEHARIEFGHQNREGRAVYFISDDGSGFDSGSAGRLFQPFQRLHSTTQFPGNGIGLATVRRIIQRHGGEIWAEGAVEKGATFYFTLASDRFMDGKPTY
jgi:signal transduction histidine kinase